VIVVAIVNTKGGVGKTTLTSALAVRAAKDSKRVALVDLDPQRSLVRWWERRGEPENPMMLSGVDEVKEAIQRLSETGWDWVFLDGPPAFLQSVEEMVEHADFVLIPMRSGVTDALASEDAIVISRDAGIAHAVVINGVVGTERVHVGLTEALKANGVPFTKTVIKHRQSHIQGMNVGKSAAEVNSSKDKKAAAEIDTLWKEVKSAAMKASKKRGASK